MGWEALRTSRALQAMLLCLVLLTGPVLTGCISDEEDRAEEATGQTLDITRKATDPPSEGMGGDGSGSGQGTTGEEQGRDPAPRVEDPLEPGPHDTAAFEYSMGTVTVGGPGPSHDDYEYTARVRGVIHHPTDLAGAGPMPVAIFLHGQHTSCGVLGEESFLRVGGCEGETVFEPYPNHRGYDYLGQHLASHGFVVVSILAKEINARNGAPDVGMWARGELVLATLDALERANDGALEQDDGPEDLGKLQGALELSRVGIMGHSRGGEGIVAALHVNQARNMEHRHAIDAVVALAPTDFNGYTAPDVPFLTLLPYCDGDVFSLHGARIFDNSRDVDTQRPSVKIQITVMGANHNHYNTQWSSDPTLGVVPDGDDATLALNRACGAVFQENGGDRLSQDETKREATLHIGGFLRWVIGGERGLAPYLTGQADMPQEACPGGSGPCPGAVHVSYHAPAYRRLMLEDGESENPFERHRLGGTVETTGLATTATCTRDSCPESPTATNATHLLLAWDEPAQLAWNLPEGFENLTSFDTVTFRVAVIPDQGENPRGQPQDLTVRLTDTSGTSASVRASDHSTALYYPPGTESIVDGRHAVTDTAGEDPVYVPFEDYGKVVANAVRIPLDALATAGQSENATTPSGGLDLTRADELALVFDQTPTGKVQIVDVQFQTETQSPW